jgi:hypothetical protein
VRVDLSRMTAAAIEAALEDDTRERRPRLSGMRAVAAGAALALAARVAVKRAPGLPHLPDLSAVSGLMRDRLADRGWLPDQEDGYDEAEYDDEEPHAEADEDDFDGDDEGEDDDDDDDDDEGPESEADPEDDLDEVDDDLDEEPEAEGHVDDEDEVDQDEDEDAEDEPDLTRNGRRTTARAPRLEIGETADGATSSETPGLLELLSAHRARPPVMSRRRRRDRVDPASRPPEPPQRASDDHASGRSN